MGRRPARTLARPPGHRRRVHHGQSARRVQPVWHVANVTRGLTGAGRLRQVPTFAALLGIESLVVNQGIKRLFGRTRPTPSGDPRYDLRTPTTSSFPSGHASAAAFAATVLTGWDGRRSIPLWWTLAATVAVSRAYVRVHHASDVVAGVGTGAALGAVARRVLAARPGRLAVMAATDSPSRHLRSPGTRPPHERRRVADVAGPRRTRSSRRPSAR